MKRSQGNPPLFGLVLLDDHGKACQFQDLLVAQTEQAALFSGSSPLRVRSLQPPAP